MIIKSALHSLRQAGVAPAVVHEAITDIDEEVVRLNRIVNEVLDFARPIQFELSRVDVNALCRESAGAALASGPGAAIAMDLDPALADDDDRSGAAADRARQPAGQRAARRPRQQWPTVTPHSRAERRVGCASASPTAAPASPPHDLAQVFDPYFTTKRGGTGLGLPIAKNIVEGLGGTHGGVEHAGQAAPTSASIFPSTRRWRAPPPRASGLRTPGAHIHDHRGSILLVDDEEKILRALGRALRDAGHGVVETTSPRQAQRLLGERTFDVLIVDNVMPEISGLDLIREIVGADARERAAADPDDDGARHGRERASRR